MGAAMDNDAPTCPFSLFDDWLAAASASEPNDPNAMTLATVDAAGRPSARIVLLKDHGPRGFTFYTNGESRKAGDMAANPHIALLFHWKSLRRQIRIEGPVTAVSDAVSNAYFATRPRAAQLGAWASDQSRPLSHRGEFEARLAAADARFAGADVPRPPHWGGYILSPERIEFWQDVEHRLHHRMMFTRANGADEWQSGLLFP
ncbi:MAG: pyridoxamine 5'-phosphate oxidase [Sphingomonadaceae bacterium]|nr:pyridoxamine 5'-phosphate oxidase [Sphingomonadaceae bacterium]